MARKTTRKDTNTAVLMAQLIVARADVAQLKVRAYVRDNPREVKAGLIGALVAGTIAVVAEVA